MVVGSTSTGARPPGGGVGLGYGVRVGAVEQGQRPADGQRRGQRPDQDGDLLAPRRRTHQEAGLQVLRRIARVRGRHRDDGGDGDRLHAVVHAGPADRDEDEAGAQQRGDRHAGDRVRGGADLAADARGYGGEEEPEDHDQGRADQVDAELRQQGEDDGERDGAADGERDRKIVLGPHPGHRLAQPRVAEVFKTRREGAQDGRKRTGEGEDPGRGHGARPDVEHEAGAQLGRTHVADQLDRRKPERLREARSYQFDRGGEHQVGEAAAGEQVAGDARADDVTDPEELGGGLGEHRGSRIEGERLPGYVGPELEPRLEEFVDEAQPERLKQALGLHAALLAGDEDLRAGGALRIDQRVVLLDDQRPAQRDHHQHAHQPAHRREQRHATDLQVVAHQEDGRNGEDHPGGHGVAGRARGLHDVVLEDRGAAERAEDRDREHRDRDGGAHGEPDLECQVDARRAEDEPEHYAQQQRTRRELGGEVRRRDGGVVAWHRAENLTVGGNTR